MKTAPVLVPGSDQMFNLGSGYNVKLEALVSKRRFVDWVSPRMEFPDLGFCRVWSMAGYGRFVDK